MKKQLMHKMKNGLHALQAFVESNRSQAFVGERGRGGEVEYAVEGEFPQEEVFPVEEEVEYAVEEDFPQEEGFPLGEEPQYRRGAYSGDLPEQSDDLNLSNYSDDQLAKMLERGEVGFLERALEFMGREAFTSRFHYLDYTGLRMVSIILGYDSDEVASAMTRLIMPEFFEQYTDEEYGIYRMLSMQNREEPEPVEFVKLVLRLNPHDEIFTRDFSEIPMSLFISASMAGKDDVVEVLLSKSQAFLNAFNSQQVKDIFVKYFIETTAPSYESCNRQQEIGFLLDKNPALAELQEVQKIFVDIFAGWGNIDYDNLGFLLQKSPVLAELYKVKELQHNIKEWLTSDPSHGVIKFLLNQDPTLAESIEMQKAFASVIESIGRDPYNKLKYLLNMHPNFAEQFSQEIKPSDEFREYDIRQYEELRFLLDRHPALVGGLAKGIQSVIRAVVRDDNYEKIESLLKGYPGFVMFFDGELWGYVLEKFNWISDELVNQRMDTLLKICPSVGKFCTELLKPRLDGCFREENLDYKKIESLLQYAPALGEGYNYEVSRRFSRDIESENPNYEEIKFLLTKFSHGDHLGRDLRIFHRLFDNALRDNQTEIIEILLEVKPFVVSDELGCNSGRSIVEQAVKGQFSHHIVTNVLKTACNVMYDMMRRGDNTFPARTLQKLIQDTLIDDALSFARRGDFTNVDLILSYFGRHDAHDIRDKLLQGSVIRGDIGTVEHIIAMTHEDDWYFNHVAKKMCDTAVAHGCGAFLEYLVARFPDVVLPKLVSAKGNVLESIMTKSVTPQGVNIVKHLLFLDPIREGMKPGVLKEYADKLKLLCTTSKASPFSSLSDDLRCKIGGFLLDGQYQPYAALQLHNCSPVPEDTLHVKVAARYMTKVIMEIVNENLTYPLVGEQLQFRTAQCVKWLEGKLQNNLEKLGVVSKHLQMQLVHDVWQAMVDQPAHHQRTKFVVENAIDAVLAPLLLEFDTPALELAGDYYEVGEGKGGDE